MQLSIIMPLAKCEELNVHLIKQLQSLSDTEILICGHHLDDLNVHESSNLRIIETDSGRAQAMNSAAALAQGKYLWFLHADSLISDRNLTDFIHKIKHTTLDAALYYFDLQFFSANTALQRLMRINNGGVYFRSRFLFSPFGDQAFLIEKDLFQPLCFPEHVPYGEDHVFVWRCRHAGIAVLPLQLQIGTSARKYEQQGWGKTSLQHIGLWLKQWFPEVIRFLSRPRL